MKADVSLGPGLEVDCEIYSVNQKDNQMTDISSENNLGTLFRTCFIKLQSLTQKYKDWTILLTLMSTDRHNIQSADLSGSVWTDLKKILALIAWSYEEHCTMIRCFFHPRPNLCSSFIHCTEHLFRLHVCTWTMWSIAVWMLLDCY